MKVRIHRWLGLAIVPLTLLMLGASPAFAAGETHKCDGDPNFPFLNEVFTHDENSPENGPIIVRRTDGQDCVISAADIHATGQIDIKIEGGGKLIIPNAANIRSLGGNVTLVSTGNDISAPNADIKADNLIDIQAGVADGSVTGSIDTMDIISNYRNVQVGDANILIRAQADLSIGKVKTNGDLGINSQRSGNVQIDANLHPANIGDISIGAGGSIEEIDIRSLTGGTDINGNPSPFKAEIGMRVENGSDNSTGNITVDDLSAIKVTQSQSRSGRLELNTNKGELVLGSGTLDASQDNFGGGNIYLFAEKITFTGAATLDNSQLDSAPKTARQIIIAASEIDYGAGNLSIISDGSGLSDAAPATIYFLPAGGIISQGGINVLNLDFTVQFNGAFFFYPGEVHFNGGTTADLMMQADGEHIQIAITGDNIVFDGKDVTVQARGKNHTKHEIVMGFFDFGSYDGTKGLQMNNTGVSLFNVRGFGGPNNSGGDIQIQVDKSDLNLGRWNLRANAGANGTDGGTILYTTSLMTLSTNTLVDFNADAALNAVGNGQILRPSNGRKAIFLNAGQSDLILGRNKEKIQFSADGGGQGGNGGAIEIVSTGQILLDRSDAVTAAVKGPSGQGGQIKIDAGTLAFSNPNGVEINVDGGMTSGNGGVIELLADGGTLDVDGTATGVKVSAKAPMDGNGGLVVFDGIGTLNIDSGNIDVSAAGNNGQGGNLFVLNNQDTNFTSGEIFANGAGNGKGGTVFIDSSNDVTLDASTINANGGDDNSDGGSITINADKLTAQNGLNVFANAGIEGNGGDISITANGNTDLDLTDAVIDASSGLSGNGGDVTITAYQVLVNGTTIRANGQDTGTGGEIDIVLMGVNQAVDLNQALAIQAMGGENGFGGTLSVTDFVPMNDPEAIINVYAETSSVAAVARPTTPQAGPTGTGGVIKVTKKGITCQFYPAADKTKWPKGYWNCAHPGGATVEDLAAINIALSLSDADRAILKSYSIYVWKNVSDFQSFTGNPPTDPNEAGETSPVSAGRGYLSVFESTPVYPTLTETQIKESAAHELGHANDHVLNESEGTGSSHSAFVLHDFQALDYDDVQTTAQLSHLRPPCTTSTFDGKPGPLVGVVDQSTQLPFCDGSGNIETKYRDPNNGGAPYRNSYILRTAAAYFYGDNVELYAHQFAWAAYVSSLTDRTKYFIYTVDGVNANNQFACTISWAQAVKAGMTRPPTSPAGCGTFKSWYPAVLGTKTSHD